MKSVNSSAAQPSASGHFFACQGFSGGFSECPQDLLLNMFLENTLIIRNFTLIYNPKFACLDLLSQIFARFDFLSQMFTRFIF
jgi:hypothetical protein